jgi:hypothetical protein
MLGVQRRRPYGLELIKRRQLAVVFLERLRHSRLIWSRPDIIGLLSNNVGSWSLLVKRRCAPVIFRSRVLLFSSLPQRHGHHVAPVPVGGRDEHDRAGFEKPIRLRRGNLLHTEPPTSDILSPRK